MKLGYVQLPPAFLEVKVPSNFLNRVNNSLETCKYHVVILLAFWLYGGIICFSIHDNFMLLRA